MKEVPNYLFNLITLMSNLKNIKPVFFLIVTFFVRITFRKYGECADENIKLNQSLAFF